MKNLELLKERIERQLKRINFQLENAIKKENKTPEYISYLQGQKETLEMTIKEIDWEETKILNNW